MTDDDITLVPGSDKPKAPPAKPAPPGFQWKNGQCMPIDEKSAAKSEPSK